MTTGAAPWTAETLTASERAFLDAALAGKRAMAHGGAIRASLLRALAAEERPEWILPPVGLSVHGAVFEGPLDLEGCAVSKPLVFLACQFNSGGERRGAVQLRDARLKRLAFYDCVIDGDVKADRINIESALFFTGSTVKGVVRLRGATIGDALAMDKTNVRRKGDIAILADGLRLGGPMILRGAAIAGEVRFAGARLESNLLWEDAAIENTGVAVTADGAICDGALILRRARIEGSMRLRGLGAAAIDAENMEVKGGTEGVNGRGADIAGDIILNGATIIGGVRFARAHVGGEFSARGATLSGSAEEWAFSAAGSAIDRGLAIRGAKLKGGLSLSGAIIGREISASNIEIDGLGRAIEADVMHVKGNWIMRGAILKGSVRLAGSQIDGQIAFTESKIEGNGGLAIRADGASAGGGWFMGRANITGVVRLPAARLGNEMRLRGTKIAVRSGPALFANGIKITRELVIDRGFESTGGIVLDHADIAGTIDLTGSRIQSAFLARGGAPAAGSDDLVDSRYDEIAISLVDTRLDRLVMPDQAEHRPRGIVDLCRAHVGSYEDFASAWPPSARAKKGETRGRGQDGRDVDHLVLDGFIYDHLENPSGLAATAKQSPAAAMRARWLEGQSEQDVLTHFKPQAWVGLARRFAAQGYHDDARQIAILRRRCHQASRSATASAKLQGWLLDVFALYGFNPWRTVLWMAAFVLLFAGVWQWAASGCTRADCKDESVFVMAQKGEFGQDDKQAAANYPPFAPLAYSLDVFLPVVNLGFEEHWRPRLDHEPLVTIPLPEPLWEQNAALTITYGHVLYIFYILEMLLGVILASLAVTGFTGILKGEDEGR